MRYTRVFAWVPLLFAVACVQHHPTIWHRAIDLPAGALEQSGIAVITPSTVTGQEEEKQAVALTFGETLQRERPGVRCVTLAETLGMVNRAGLAEAYRRMYEDYRDTGLFERDTLRRVGALTGVRYVAQLKLQGFHQGEKDRLGVFGLRLLETKYGDVRLFLQIWDSGDGGIVWEGVEELRIAAESVVESHIALTRLVERASQDLIKRLP